MDGKHALLAEGVYTFFATEFGSKDQGRSMVEGREASTETEGGKGGKRKARRVFMNEKRTGSISPDQVLALARKFYQSVRAHSRLNKRWQRSVDTASAKLAKDQCHSHFWSFTQQLLDNKPQSGVVPTFMEDEATDFFSTVYHAEPQTFHQPAWMPSPSPPVTEFNCD